MPDDHIAKRLHRRIILCSTAGMLIVGLVIGLVGVLPMTQQLREAQRQNLLVDLQRQTVAVERFVSRTRNISAGGANRTKIREALAAYNRSELTTTAFTNIASPVLAESLAVGTNVIGIQIHDLRSNILIKAGMQIPTNQWIWPDPATRESAISFPFRHGNETYIAAGANILGPDLARVGVAMTISRTRGLQMIVEDYTNLGKSGETVVGSRQNKALPIFCPLRTSSNGRQPPAERITAIMEGIQRGEGTLRGEGLQRGEENHGGLFEPEAPMDTSLIMACGPVNGAPWGIVVTRDKTELYSGVNRMLITLSTVIIILIVGGAAGMVVVLRPLTGRAILHTDDLESQISEKTAALNVELAERRRAETLARDSEALYHSLVDTLPINILRKDLNGRVSYGNRGYCERMGKPLAELIGRSDYDLFPDELAKKYLSDDQKVIRTGEMFEDIEEHRTSDGRKSYVHVLKAPVRDALGTVVGTQVIFWDVTARKLAEEALETAAAELARSNKELEQFAYVASHDLQEPLRMVTSYTQLISRRYNDHLDDDAKDFMRFAVDGAMRMQKLIQGLLEYSRVGTRGKPFEQVDCNAVLDAALANLVISREEAKASITRDTLPLINGDAVQLTQLFQNLIGNAIKFRGAIPPQSHVSAKRSALLEAATPTFTPHEWIFSVRDNGIGIEPQYFERIFVIFQRLHTQEQYAGTGIGLAICKKIVERHGGRIWLESKPGEGTTFYFAVPAID